jgi:hypothetical protein
LTVALDENQRAESEIYVNDGESFDYSRGGLCIGDSCLKRGLRSELVEEHIGSKVDNRKD